MYRVIGGEKRLGDGWEYSFHYPALNEQPELDPDRAYLLAMLVVAEDGERDAFHAVVPIHEPSKIWDRILAASSPRGGRRPSPAGDRGGPRDSLRRR